MVRTMMGLAVLAMALAAGSATAEENAIVGTWEGKSKDGKAMVMEFKTDGSVVLIEDGKPLVEPGMKFTYKLDTSKTPHPLDVVMSAEGINEVFPMLVQFVDAKKAKFSSPKEHGTPQKRPESLEAGETVEFTKK